jgi:hypothetical protein
MDDSGDDHLTSLQATAMLLSKPNTRLKRSLAAVSLPIKLPTF